MKGTEIITFLLTKVKLVLFHNLCHTRQLHIMIKELRCCLCSMVVCVFSGWMFVRGGGGGVW